jgi:RNA polymerase sigma-70 factor (ECF subfamily)
MNETLAELRPVAFGVAYRMLGSVAEAEDVVQEALLRFHAASDVESPRAFVATVATRLAIDQLRSARARRETYPGDWLPEPLVTDASAEVELADSLSTAFLILLESLTPEQRAAFLLHDVFDYGYDEVAEVVHTSEANARQLASRARRHVEERRPRFEPSREQRDDLAQRFFAAARDGDLEGLEQLLAADVVLRGDGGGKAPALARALQGAGRVARTLRAWWRQIARRQVHFRVVELNGQPGAIFFDGEGRVISTLSLEIGDGKVQAINGVVNPDKLGHLGEVANLREFLSR